VNLELHFHSLSIGPPAPAAIQDATVWESQGRNLFTAMVIVTLATPRIGLIAGLVGVGRGSVPAFVAAHYHGWVEALFRCIADVGLALPQVMAPILIVIAMLVYNALNPFTLAQIVSSLGWRHRSTDRAGEHVTNQPSVRLDGVER
jgi:hypothetical protein